MPLPSLLYYWSCFLKTSIQSLFLSGLVASEQTSDVGIYSAHWLDAINWKIYRSCRMCKLSCANHCKCLYNAPQESSLYYYQHCHTWCQASVCSVQYESLSPVPTLHHEHMHRCFHQIHWAEHRGGGWHIISPKISRIFKVHGNLPLRFLAK